MRERHKNHELSSHVQSGALASLGFSRNAAMYNPRKLTRRHAVTGEHEETPKEDLARGSRVGSIARGGAVPFTAERYRTRPWNAVIVMHINRRAIARGALTISTRTQVNATETRNGERP